MPPNVNATGIAAGNAKNTMVAFRHPSHAVIRAVSWVAQLLSRMAPVENRSCLAVSLEPPPPCMNVLLNPILIACEALALISDPPTVVRLVPPPLVLQRPVQIVWLSPNIPLTRSPDVEVACIWCAIVGSIGPKKYLPTSPKLAEYVAAESDPVLALTVRLSSAVTDRLGTASLYWPSV